MYDYDLEATWDIWMFVDLAMSFFSGFIRMLFTGDKAFNFISKAIYFPIKSKN